MAKKKIDELMSVGVDIGKDTFHLVGFDREGQLVLRKKFKRLALVATFKKLPRCIVGMEACLSAHFVSRTLRGLGFEPRIIPAIYVKPFIKGQKNDYNDAEAIAEAALRPNLPYGQICRQFRRKARTSSTCRRCTGFDLDWFRDEPHPSTRFVPS